MARSRRVTRRPQTPSPRRYRFGLHWRGRLDATSREYLAPVVPSAPGSRGPMARRRRRRRHHRSVLHLPALCPPPPAPPIRVRTRSLSRADNRTSSAFRRLSSSVLFPPSPLSACPRSVPLSVAPRTLRFPLSLSSALSASPWSYAGCLVYLLLSLSPFALPPSPPPASAAVSMPRSDDGHSQTHPGKQRCGGERGEGDSGFLVRNCYRSPRVHTYKAAAV